MSVHEDILVGEVVQEPVPLFVAEGIVNDDRNLAHVADRLDRAHVEIAHNAHVGEHPGLVQEL